jgi:hypothetical protein
MPRTAARRVCRTLLGCVIASGLSGFEAGAGTAHCYHVANVDFWDVLYIRSERSHLSRAVGAIAPDHSGTIRVTGPCLPAGANPKKQWCPVAYNPLPSVQISGFVKAWFVKPAACPPE